MERNQHRRQRSSETRQLLTCMVAARELYAIYLREVAAGERTPDPEEMAVLKFECEKTLSAWNDAKQTWQETPPSYTDRIKNELN